MCHFIYWLSVCAIIGKNCAVKISFGDAVTIFKIRSTFVKFPEEKKTIKLVYVIL